MTVTSAVIGPTVHKEQCALDWAMTGKAKITDKLVLHIVYTNKPSSRHNYTFLSYIFHSVFVLLLCLCSREGRESCHWVSSVRPVKGKFHFNLSHSLSPYAEESTMLKLTAEAITTDSILRGTKSFYLRDISELTETGLH